MGGFAASRGGARFGGSLQTHPGDDLKQGSSCSYTSSCLHLELTRFEPPKWGSGSVERRSMVFQSALKRRSVVLAAAISATVGGSALADTRFAVIGDFGNGVAETAVANRLKTFNPEFIISVGD